MRAFVFAAMAFASALHAQEAINPSGAERYIRPSQRIEVAPGRSLNLVCMGSGERTVLLDAGGSDWSVVWALVQPVIAEKARACAYDRAGLGYSDPAPGPRSPIAIVEDLHALIRLAGLKTPLVLVGHSLGGFNMKLYAALYPEHVAGLLLIDPAEERSWNRTRSLIERAYGRTLAARSELLDQRFIASLAERYRDCAEAARSSMLDPGSKTYRRCSDPVRPQLSPMIAAEREKLQVRFSYQSAQASEIASSVYADSGSDQVYARLFRRGMFGARPVIVLTHQEPASGDPLDEIGKMQGLALHRETAGLSHRGVHREIAGSGHYIQLDKPDVVAGAVREILRMISSDHGRGVRPKAAR